MTETERLADNDLARMFACLRGRRVGGPRKRLLIGLAVCDRVGRLMPDVGREAGAAERFSAGQATEAERWRAFERAGEASEEAMCDGNPPVEAALSCADRVTQVAAENEFPANWDDDTPAHMAFSAAGAFPWAGTGWDAAVSAAHVSSFADPIRCVFGNPFRPVAFSPRLADRYRRRARPRDARVAGLFRDADPGGRGRGRGLRRRGRAGAPPGDRATLSGVLGGRRAVRSHHVASSDS